MTQQRRIILVSGMPRSGTTTIGDVLGTSPHTATLYEPMNFHSGDRVVGRYFDVPGTVEFPNATFDDLVARMFRLKLHLKSGVWPEDKGLRRAAKYLIGGRSRTSLRKAKWTRNVETIIWKDPIAAFAMRRFIETEQGQAVITLRSPFAVAASFKRMGWGFKLDDIFPRLEAVGVATPEGWQNADISDNATNAALLWAALYGDQLALAKSHPDSVTIVDLDDIIRDPMGSYKHLFAKLDLPWTDKTENFLETLYKNQGADKGAVPTGHAHSKNRDVSQANQYWRKTLSEDEIATVEKWTAPVRDRFAPN